MTPEELTSRVNRIIDRDIYDDEAQHADEDSLHLDLIKAFCPEWVIAEVDRLSAANFERWCA